MRIPWARFWWSLGMVIVLAALYMCLAPGKEVPGVFELNDKISHAAGHTLLTLYFTGLVARGRWWKVVLFFTLFGAGVEVAQYYMHVGREADARDLIANAAGVSMGLLLAYLGVSRWPFWFEALFGRKTVKGAP
jgi:VanZ family protein